MSFTPRTPRPSMPAGGVGSLTSVKQLPLVQRFRLNSIGTKLFISIVGGALVGVGSIAFLFGEIVKYQAETQIQQSVSDKVQLLNGRLEQAELFAESLRTSLLALRLRNTNSADTYQRLLFELFKDRPSFVMGLGFGQSQNGILPQQQWFAAHYYLDSGEADAPGMLLSSPYNDIRYVDGTQSGSFYPNSDRYRTFFAPQEDVWSSPALEEQNKTTYYAQIRDERDGWLGTTFVELAPTAFEDVIDTPVMQEAGYTALLTRTGQVIANPLADADADPTATHQSIPGLDAVWAQMTGQAGILEGDQGYWAYQQLPEKEWIAVAFVPYEVVFDRVALITVGGTLSVGLVLAGVVALWVRSLNHRLRPLLDECYRLAGEGADRSALQRQDEVEQISTAFFNALEQLKLDQEKSQQDLVHRVQTEEQLKQMAIAEQSNQALQAEVEQLLTLVAAVEAGDLTVEARAGGATSSIANTLNRLVERLGYVIAIVLGTTKQVAQGANQLGQVAVAVSENAEQQTQSVVQVQNLIETVDGLSQSAAQQIAATSEAVQLTQTATRQGQQEITTIFEGIGSLQQNTNQIAKRIEMLTSYVELAAQFAKDQKRIASMTRILAVNASMLANRAAVQQDPEQFASITREFETVAAQVDDLASQTNQSLILLQQRTDQIQTTVSGLDYDVQEISQQVSDFTLGVDQSLQVFNTIQTASEQVDQTWQQMVQSSQAIATAVPTALQSIRTIAAIAAETSNQANLTKDQTQQMEQLAQTLLQTVEFFKLRPNTLSNANANEFPFPNLSRNQTPKNGHSFPESHTNTVDISVSQSERGQLIN